MKVGVTFPNNWGIEDAQAMLAIGPRAEELGFDSLWVMDHLFHVGFVSDRLGERPYYHPMAVLSYLAATTSKITLGTSVMVLPYHNPVELAKYFVTLDHLSGGRVILGVGVGALTPEFEVLGVSMSDRAKLTDEGIKIMKELWTNGRPTFKSPRWDIKDVGFYPRPVQTPLPIWVGGMAPGAMKRAATLGDGWHPNGATPENYRAKTDEVRAMAVAAGRDPAALTMSARIEVGVRGEHLGDTSHTALVWADDQDAMRTLLQQYRDAGCEHIVLALASGEVPLIQKSMEQIARVLADVR